MSAEAKQRKPPYVPWKTFRGFIEQLSQTALPPVIDRSLMPRMSGATQSHLKSALTYLGLIEEKTDLVTGRLRGLVDAFGSEHWPTELASTLQSAYRPIIARVEIEAGTTAQLREAFRTAGAVEGQVAEKSIRFFLAGMKEAQLPISPHFKLGGTRSSRNGRSSPRQKKKSPRAAERSAPSREAQPQHSTSVPDGFVAYQYPLRPDLMIEIALPLDLTSTDVERLHRWLATLPMERS